MPVKYTTDTTGKAVPIIIADTAEQAERDHQENREATSAAVHVISQNIDEGIIRLAKSTGISKDMLESVFQFEKNGPVLLSSIAGDRAEKFKGVCLPVLVAYEAVYGQSVIKSSIIKSFLDDAGVNTSTDYGSFLRAACKGLIVPVGSGPGISYKLTTPGRKEGLRLIKELSEGGTVA
jgi:hypothetical protein